MKRIKILGEYWRLIWVPKGKELKFKGGERMAPSWRGLCDISTDKRKAIRIRKGLSQEIEMDTVIHECLHAAIEQLRKRTKEEYGKGEEAFVTRIAGDIAHILWRMGWRKKEGRG